MRYTYEKLIREILEKSDTPLTASEIWKNAESSGKADLVCSGGKTPWKTIEAKIYVDLKRQREQSIESDLVKMSSRPARFGLKSKDYMKKSNAKGKSEVCGTETKRKNKDNTYSERDLHPLLAKFAFSDEHFKCYSKTIYHEKSLRKTKGKNKWLHPDMVGVHFPFEDYHNNTLDVIGAFNESAAKIFSFELKKEIDFNNLREYFFQAVSNSSWANEGYLVAVKYSDESEFTDEMQRLNNAFGIGFIKLNVEHIEQSEILLPSKTKEKIDWETVNRLVEENNDFSDFVKHVVQDIAVSNVRGTYDKILEDDEYAAYLSQKGLLVEWQR